MKKLLILNGSPHVEGTVAALLKGAAEGAEESGWMAEWYNVYRLSIKPCTGCMRCRTDGKCVLPEDDAHRFARRLGKADALIVGTPVYWGNMSSGLKQLFERVVPVLMGEGAKGHPEIPERLRIKARRVGRRLG